MFLFNLSYFEYIDIFFYIFSSTSEAVQIYLINDTTSENKMNQISKRIEYKTTTALVVVAALAAVLVGSTAAVGTGHMAFAGNGSKSNDGINVPTITKQPQECQSAGGTSPITGACIATSTNTIDESGGVISEGK